MYFLFFYYIKFHTVAFIGITTIIIKIISFGHCLLPLAHPLCLACNAKNLSLPGWSYDHSV